MVDSGLQIQHFPEFGSVFITRRNNARRGFHDKVVASACARRGHPPRELVSPDGPHPVPRLRDHLLPLADDRQQRAKDKRWVEVLSGRRLIFDMQFTNCDLRYTWSQDGGL